MTSQRALLAAALLLAVPVVAAVAFGVPSLGGFPGPGDDAGTPEPFVDVQTPTPTVAERRTPTASPTATTDAESRTSRPDEGTVSPTATDDGQPTQTPTQTVTTDEPPDDEPEDDPEDDEPETATPGESPTATTDEQLKTSRPDEGTVSPTATDGPPDPATDSPPETPTDRPSPTARPTDSPTRTETPPATDGGTDDPSSRQCTHDRDGHDKPPLPAATTPPSDAQRVEAGDPVSGSVEMDQSNWYAVDVERGETLSAVVEGSPEGLDLAIFGPDGTPIDAIETATADRTAFGAQVERSGTYYVRVSAGDGYGGFYRLTVERAGPDDFDPNDERARALPVASGAETTATLTEGETDWFAIKLPANSSLSATVTVEGHALGRDVRVGVFDPDGERLTREGGTSETTFYPSSGSNTATASANATTEGIYYVRVSCAALDGHATYTITIETDTNA